MSYTHSDKREPGRGTLREDQKDKRIKQLVAENRKVKADNRQLSTTVLRIREDQRNTYLRNRQCFLYFLLFFYFLFLLFIQVEDPRSKEARDREYEALKAQKERTRINLEKEVEQLRRQV